MDERFCRPSTPLCVDGFCFLRLSHFLGITAGGPLVFRVLILVDSRVCVAGTALEPVELSAVLVPFPVWPKQDVLPLRAAHVASQETLIHVSGP